MLSATNTVTDIKAKLRNTYSFYGFASDAVFISAIEESVDTVKYDVMYPALSSIQENAIAEIGPGISYNNLASGKSFYDLIAAKDKVNLNVVEEYIYWAEVWLSMSELIGALSDDFQYNVNGDSESISTEGYSSSVSGLDKSGKLALANKYYLKGYGFLVKAGVQQTSLWRGGR